ncbi:MAG TPA: 2-succinyl-5-enolpyruvyl-6-hydroxy-3-cyclohexene-1-carboxylic-acid synthase [Chloroflexota bacterium]|nr:2-succinyl-5-enolpyruvyl-6-hydroxy-3-cyclohexene-1-carboxylic-acid synthase [Chloroflexota bacterium]
MYAEVLGRYVGALVDELARAGVRHVCVSPGSRSTPLALVLAEERRLRLWMHYDERSAAYFALGIAKASGEPVVLVCTSGTAAANYLPAMVEAKLSRVPLVVLTADRPPELRDVGAPQTIDQVRLYGGHVKWFADALLPEPGDEALRYVRALAARAVATARGTPAGPVHLNLPFREPLVPVPPVEPDSTARPDGQPYVAVSHGRLAPDAETIARLAAALSPIERGLIVCGPHGGTGLGSPVARLARALGWPVLADPLSGVRTGPHDRSLVLDAYDAVLRDERFAASFAVDAVLRFGAMATSKPVLLYLQSHPTARQVVVDGGAGWNEPTALAAEVVHADEALLCDALVDAVPPRRRSGWLEAWLGADRAARRAIASTLARIDEPFEGRVFAELADLLPDGATLYAGNSMPIRDLDTFFPATAKAIRFLSNRGANGIDGVVSSALGASVVSEGPLVLAIGDLSLYHDMNGLLAAKLHGLDAMIVLLHNDGGGIFSFLPQAAHPTHFELLFGTPHGLDFRPAVEMYGGRFDRVTTWPAFREAAARALREPGLKVVEVPTERRRNVELHRRVWPAVAAALAEPLSRWEQMADGRVTAQTEQAARVDGPTVALGPAP